VGGVGGWVWKLEIKTNSAQLELELGLSLAIMIGSMVTIVMTKKWTKLFNCVNDSLYELISKSELCKRMILSPPTLSSHYRILI
jgi:hypothetical protein